MVLKIVPKIVPNPNRLPHAHHMRSIACIRIFGFQWPVQISRGEKQIMTTLDSAKHRNFVSANYSFRWFL
jgi:hypothetical protein